MTQSSDPCNEILFTIRKIIRAVDVHSKRLRLEAGVTSPQLILLKEISGSNGEITTTILAEHVCLSQSTVTNILDRLVEKGFVIRTRGSSDKRMWFLDLTAAGLAILDNSPAPLQEEFIQSFSSLPEWQQSQMLETLQRIASMMHHDKAAILG